ncbi:MAG: ABC transporter ATP-binding protein, partial [Reyranellales bacterium]
MTDDDDICRYQGQPLRFLWRHASRRPIAHTVILLSVLGAVACSVSTQYGVKFLVDVLSEGPGHAGSPWLAFAVLVLCVAADNFLWR